MAPYLKNDKTLSEYTLEILSKCKGCGYLIGISTPRGDQNCLSFLRKLKPDILISSGGVLVRVNGKLFVLLLHFTVKISPKVSLILYFSTGHCES